MVCHTPQIGMATLVLHRCGFPHPFPIMSAILAGKVKSFCFPFLFELIDSGSNTAGFAVNPKLTELLFFLKTSQREEGIRPRQGDTVSISRVNPSHFFLSLQSIPCALKWLLLKILMSFILVYGKREPQISESPQYFFLFECKIITCTSDF